MNLFSNKNPYDKYKDLIPDPKYHPNFPHSKNYVVFDFETTGIDPYSCEIIEIGAIKVTDGVMVGKYHSYVKPKKLIPIEATNVNHITNKMVSNAPKAEIVMPQFINLIGDSNLVGYNIVNFDFIILQRYAIDICKTTLNNYVSDVFLLSKKYLKLPKNKLIDLANYYNIDTNNAHHAVDDCIMTYECYKKIQELRRQQIKKGKE